MGGGRKERAGRDVKVAGLSSDGYWFVSTRETGGPWVRRLEVGNEQCAREAARHLADAGPEGRFEPEGTGTDPALLRSATPVAECSRRFDRVRCPFLRCLPDNILPFSGSLGVAECHAVCGRVSDWPSGSL